MAERFAVRIVGNGRPLRSFAPTTDLKLEYTHTRTASRHTPTQQQSSQQQPSSQQSSQPRAESPRRRARVVIQVGKTARPSQKPQLLCTKPAETPGSPRAVLRAASPPPPPATTSSATPTSTEVAQPPAPTPTPAPTPRRRRSPSPSQCPSPSLSPSPAPAPAPTPSTSPAPPLAPAPSFPAPPRPRAAVRAVPLFVPRSLAGNGVRVFQPRTVRHRRRFVPALPVIHEHSEVF